MTRGEVDKEGVVLTMYKGNNLFLIGVSSKSLPWKRGGVKKNDDDDDGDKWICIVWERGEK